MVIVGDRGVLTEARIGEHVASQEGLQWITALRGPAIRELVEQGAIQQSLFDERGLVEIHSPDYPNERLVVCRNPLLAEQRARTRQELLEATEKALQKIAQAVRREKRPLRGKEKIALRVGKVLDRYKVGKHFKIEIRDDAFSYQRDEAKIAEEAALDGLYVLRTNIPKEQLSPEQTVAAYKRLSRVERAFRSLKTVDLKIRPIYHRLGNRVKAHVFLCMLAYYVEWHMRQKLAPLIFDEEDWSEAARARRSPVAPATRSRKAQRKARQKTTGDDVPVHSFPGLLDELATLTLNETCLTGHADGKPFWMQPRPTEVQAKAFALLGIQP